MEPTKRDRNPSVIVNKNGESIRKGSLVSSTEKFNEKCHKEGIGEYNTPFTSLPVKRLVVGCTVLIDNAGEERIYHMDNVTLAKNEVK